MVAINDPMRNMAVSFMKTAGIRDYAKDIREDDSRDFRESVNLILNFYKYPASKLLIKALLPQIPQEEQYIDAAARAFLRGVQEAATEAGHFKNAEYVSQAIKKLNEKD